ncbi:MAG: sulfatase [Verrucomicrobia bacterium]|nr:sulfatase [Verrucomicrobiota bacterium]
MKPVRLIASLILALFIPALNAADKPNFIVINIDDLGYADIGPFGSKLNRTPNLDRMAREGRKLTCFYAAPVCSPSRSALMTGCYPKRVLPIPGVLFPAGAVGLNPAERTVAELLKEAGYATACIGKWHLGDQPEFLPTAQGFDYYLGIPYSNDMGPGEEGSKSNLGDKLPDARLSALTGNDESGLKGASQPPLPLVENGKVIARVGPDEQQGIVERYTTAAVKFIRSSKDRPFFLYLPHNAVHFPIYPGKKWAGKSPNGYYSDWVEEVDWSVGQVLDTLRTLKLDTKTLVIFTSDNGGTARAVNAPLRGNKGSTWEGGMRVPTIAWWPGKIPAGTSTDEITGMLDILPTFAKLGGGKVPTDRKLDGLDISPVLLGEAGAKGHEVFHYFRGFKLEAIRSGPWKLHFGVGAGVPAKNAKDAKKKGTQKAAPKANPSAPPASLQLFNLDSDLGESLNVAAANPDVVKKLRALADAMKDDLGLDGIGPGCRPLGRVANPQPLIGKDGAVRADAVGKQKRLP